MQRMKPVVFGLLMAGVGYWCGIAGVSLNTLTAQENGPDISTESVSKIRELNRRLQDAMETLQTEGKYESITKDINSFLILSGGGNARLDLESGRGVDPETFAALYAGRALPEIQALLGTDDQGRLTYNDEVIRIYSKSRLESIFANRLQITEVLGR